ncbi:unnamed protein product [Gongylonema pulchrum]|uniref:MFS domain-containing protein n=1 Tax=Gongylonema pulchrum TaxID=637853 RepID=A0A183CZQ3_9BILA|nr:unnamed protein product [Gongylonema pulchrum]
MMDGFYLLTTLSIAMLVGSFLAGLIPLAFVMSEGRTRLLSTFGAGLLVGTALSIIIPEGVESLYLAETEKHAVAQNEVVEQPDAYPQDQQILPNGPAPLSQNQSYVFKSKFEDTNVVKRKARQAALSPVVIAGSATRQELKHAEVAKTDIASISKSIGYSLVTGFIFMLIVDQISRSASSKGQFADRIC